MTCNDFPFLCTRLGAMLGVGRRISKIPLLWFEVWPAIIHNVRVRRRIFLFFEVCYCMINMCSIDMSIIKSIN